jgi:hypothetical protein
LPGNGAVCFSIISLNPLCRPRLFFWLIL